MVTMFMQKVAADFDKKDAAIASGLGLAGGVATNLPLQQILSNTKARNIRNDKFQRAYDHVTARELRAHDAETAANHKAYERFKNVDDFIDKGLGDSVDAAGLKKYKDASNFAHEAFEAQKASNAKELAAKLDKLKAIKDALSEKQFRLTPGERVKLVGGTALGAVLPAAAYLAYRKYSNK